MTDVQQSPADIELQSTKSTIPDHEAQASLLFPNRPEIKRTIAIYNYHAVGGVGSVSMPEINYQYETSAIRM
jgi:hypothetical protein